MMRPGSQAPSGIVPNRHDVLTDVIQIVGEHMAMPVDRIDESSALFEDIGCDSLDIVEISMELEDHFDISIPDEFDEKTRTIGDVTDGVQQLLAGTSPS